MSPRPFSTRNTPFSIGSLPSSTLMRAFSKTVASAAAVSAALGVGGGEGEQTETVDEGKLGGMDASPGP